MFRLREYALNGQRNSDRKNGHLVAGSPEVALDLAQRVHASVLPEDDWLLEPCLSPQALLARADKALYWARHDGQDCVRSGATVNRES